MRIFVCDDDPDMQFLLSYILKKAGHLPVIIPDKKSLFNRSSPEADLILMDLRFGDDYGLDVLKSWTYECPVILITGVQNPDLQGQGNALGIIDIIRKPFNPVELITYFKSLSLK